MVHDNSLLLQKRHSKLRVQNGKNKNAKHFKSARCFQIWKVFEFLDVWFLIHDSSPEIFKKWITTTFFDNPKFKVKKNCFSDRLCFCSQTCNELNTGVILLIFFVDNGNYYIYRADVFFDVFKAGRDMKVEGIQESPETVQYTKNYIKSSFDFLPYHRKE